MVLRMIQYTIKGTIFIFFDTKYVNETNFSNQTDHNSNKNFQNRITERKLKNK